MAKNTFFRKTNFPKTIFTKVIDEEQFIFLKKYHENFIKNQHEIARIKDLCIDGLNEEVRHFSESDEKNKFLKFVRSFYNERGNLEDKFQAIKRLFPEKIAINLEGYFQLKNETAQLEEKFDLLGQNKYFEEKETILKGLKANPNFLENTKMIGLPLYDKFTKLSETDVHNHNKRQRQMDSFLYNYFSRISVKTSPLGYLASTGWDHKEEGEKNEFMSVNCSILLHVFDKLCLVPKFQKYVEFKLNGTLIEKDNKYYVTFLDSVDKKGLYRNKQELSVIKKNEFIERLIDKLEDHTLTGEEILEIFPETIRHKYLQKLIQIGFILTDKSLKVSQSKTMTESLLEELKSIPGQNFVSEIQYLENIAALEKLPFSWENHAQLTQAVDGLVSTFEIEGFDKESYVLVDTLIKDKEKNILEQVNLVRENEALFDKLSRFILIFDISTRNKYLAYQLLKEKYGGRFIPKNSREISGFLRNMAETIFQKDGYWMEAFGYMGENYENEIDRRLANLKHQLIDQMNQYQSTETDEILLSNDFVEKSLASLENIVGHGHCSRSYFVQVDDKNQMVINHVYKGYGVYRRRFNHYIASENENYGLNGELLDIPATFGFNANIRETTKELLDLPLADNTLVGENSKSINWLNLGFRLSETTKEVEIFNRSDGQIVYPHFLGSLITAALPSIVAILNAITLNDSIYFDFGSFFLREKLKTIAADKIIIPRICFLDSKLILSRKKWYLKTTKMKEIFSSELSFEKKWMTTVHYFESEDLPHSFYIQGFLEKYEVDSELLKEKPLYINLSSILSFKILLGLINKKDRVLIEEALPDSVYSKEETVSELIFETDDVFQK